MQITPTFEIRFPEIDPIWNHPNLTISQHFEIPLPPSYTICTHINPHTFEITTEFGWGTPDSYLIFGTNTPLHNPL